MKVGLQFALVIALAAFPLSLCGQQKPESPAPHTESSILQEYDQSIDQIAERAMRSVVQIDVTSYSLPEHGQGENSQNFQRQRALGSGVIVDPDGYIVTNNHVVSGALRIRVTISPATTELVTGRTVLSRKERIYEAKLIGTNRYADLAVIKIEEKNLPFIPLQENYNIRLGQTVIAIGSPEGLAHTVTKGIISALGRQPEADRPMVYVQTDAPINPGNSGGPLIDRNGNLVGINTFIFTSGGGSEGLGFAIPEPIVRFAYMQLKQFGTIPASTIGAHAQTITPTLAAGLKLSQDWGVIISDVDANGPAAAAGLHPMDLVLSIDGVPIDSLPKYAAFLYLHPRGRRMAMQVLRNGERVSAVLTPIPAVQTIENLSDLVNPTTDLISPLGIFVLDLKRPLADAMGTHAVSGVIVAGLLSGEPATLADLRVGDVITSINSQPVSDTEHLRQDIARFKPGDAVALAVERSGIMQYVAFEVE